MRRRRTGLVVLLSVLTGAAPVVASAQHAPPLLLKGALAAPGAAVSGVGQTLPMIVRPAAGLVAPLAQGAVHGVAATAGAVPALVAPVVGGSALQAPAAVLTGALGAVAAAPAPLVQSLGGAVETVSAPAARITSVAAFPPAIPQFAVGSAALDPQPSTSPYLASSGAAALLLGPPPAPADRRSALAARLAAFPQALEADRGEVVARGRVLALNPSDRAFAAASELGLALTGREDWPALGLSAAVFQAPAGLAAGAALMRLQALDPGGRYALDVLYEPAGEVGTPARKAPTGARNAASGVRIGLIDSGVDASHPSLRGARIVQRGFAGAVAARPHGLATASLLAGSDGPFRGAGAGAELYVADIYGRAADGGSALALVRALAWMAEMKAPVINVSLVGPANPAVGAAVEALARRGILVVAAAGNDGPAAPPLYPAAYPGVVAVTAVDARSRVLPEAGRGPHLSFAAPGADMAAAGVGGYVTVRGTSFAAPLVAARLAERLSAPDPAAAQAALAALAGEARDLGAPGRDPVYGMGLVAADARTPPPAVGATGLLRGD